MSDGASNGLRQLRAVRAAGTITLDGTLDEPAWAVAPLARNFVQSEPREGEPATYDTEVRVLYDDDALYFGVFARDEQPAGIIVSDLKKDRLLRRRRSQKPLRGAPAGSAPPESDLRDRTVWCELVDSFRQDL